MTMMTQRMLLISLALFVAASSAMHAPGGSSRLLAPFAVGLRRASTSYRPTRPKSASAISKDFVETTSTMRGGISKPPCSGKPPARFLKFAYSACGLATTAAWSTMVYTTIRSNQPPGAMMPCWQHGFFARIGAMSAAPLIIGGFASLASSASKARDSWEPLCTPTCRRHNLALATTGVASALWCNFAETITKIPGTNPAASHQIYHGAMKWGLIGCYGSGALLGAAVWARSLPDNIRRNPLLWPGRITDGISQSLVSLGPANRDDPVNVKYSLLTVTFLVFTGMQTLCNMPISVIPSWTSRRLSRAFPIWCLLGAVTSFDLKEAAESGKLWAQESSKYYRTLSNSIKGFGTLYLGARAGAVFFDPSFPEAFHAVNQVPGLAVAAILLVTLTLRSDLPIPMKFKVQEEDSGIDLAPTKERLRNLIGDNKNDALVVGIGSLVVTGLGWLSCWGTQRSTSESLSDMSQKLSVMSLRLDVAKGEEAAATKD